MRYKYYMIWLIYIYVPLILSFCLQWVGLHFNSLAHGKFDWNFRYVIFQGILLIDGWDISCEMALKWMSVDFTDDQSALVQVMAWCRQATSHNLSQCWPSSTSPYGVTRPQLVKQQKIPVPNILNLTNYWQYAFQLNKEYDFVYHYAFYK